MERTLSAANQEDVPVLVPRPGESVEPAAEARLERWWPDVPWQTAGQSPVVSSQLPERLLAAPLGR